MSAQYLNSKPLWSWPHLLGLDAPVVAIVWHSLVSKNLQPIPNHYTWALGLSVWTIYLLDRLLDSRHAPSPHEPLRHSFTRQARLPLSILAAANLIALTQLGPLPILPALPILAALALYFLAVHATRVRLPKELAVATIFALGVSIPIHPFPFTLDFLFLCFWNCAAIEFWEQGPSRLHPISAFLARYLPQSALIAAAICLVCAPIFNPVVQLTLAITFLLCAALALHVRQLSPLALRIFADLILLTPLLVL